MLFKFLAGLCLALCCVALTSAQNVQVSGAVSGNGTYANLGTAFAAINGGSQTGAVIDVAIIGSTNEPVSGVLTAGSWTSLRVRPSGGVRFVTGSVTGPLIDLNGADNVTIDGVNSGGNQLAIENQSSASTASTIRLINDATSNTMRNLTLRGASTGTNSGIVLFSTASAGGNDNNTLTNSTLDVGASFPTNAVVSEGTGGNDNSGNTISNNDISNFFSATQATRGVTLISASDAWTISNNKFFQTSTRTFTTANVHIVINISSGSGHTISGNTIGFSNANGFGTYTMAGTIQTRFIGINLAVGTAATTSVQGNRISAISLATSSGAGLFNGVLCGINVTSGNVEIGTTTGNTIGSTSGTGSLVVTSTSSGALVVGVHSSSTGSITIRNNSFGAMTSSGTTANTAGSVSGVASTAAAASLTISNNVIGNTVADNMRGGTLGLTTGASNVAGVNVTVVPATLSISSNTIRNLSSYGTSTGSVRGIVVSDSNETLSSATVTSNTITGLTTNAFTAGSTSGSTGTAGITIRQGRNSVISQNVISGLANINTGTGQYVVAGISIGGGSGLTISRNRIFGLSNAGTSTVATAPATVAGVVVSSQRGSAAITNNMIAIGSGQTTNTVFAGVLINSLFISTPPSFEVLFNSINIEGNVASGEQPSFGFVRTNFSSTAVTVPVNVRGNLLVNTRSGGSGGHFAIGNNFGAVASATGWTSENNVHNANSATVGYWNSARTFSDWQSTAQSDLISFTAVPVTFVDPASDLHLNMGLAPTILESNATLVSGVTTDFDGQSRPGPTGSVNGGGGVLADFGADEFDGVVLDTQAPTIGLTALVFNCDSNDRTLTATLVDATGVPTSGGLVPRLYFRKNNDAYVSTPGTLSAGTAQNGTWTFTLSPSLIGGVATGDTVSYFVIAQDSLATPNIGSNPLAGLVATDVNNVTTPPTNPFSYVLSSNLGGTYTVGSSGNFPTLTAAAAAYGTSCLTGPVLFSLIDATYPAESTPITIGANPYSSAVNRLTIKPAAGVTPTVSASAGSSVFLLSGADFVTIDGSSGFTPNSLNPLSAASRDLTIAATTTTPTAIVWISQTSGGDSATNIVIQNVTVTGVGNQFGLGAGGATVGNAGADNNNLSFINNQVSGVQYGIYTSGAGAFAKNENLIINQNRMVTGITQSGIYVAFTNNIQISGNEIGNLTNENAFQEPVGINVGFNAINGFGTNTTGIADGASNVVITGNRIFGITHSGTYSAVGIALGNTVSGMSLIANNMVSGVLSNGTVNDFSAGILLGGGTAPINVIHNSVSIDGTMPGTEAGMHGAFALAVTATVTPSALTIQNNILSMTAAGNAGATTRFAPIGYQFGAPFTTVVSNRNDLYSVATGPGNYGIGATGGLVTGPLQTTLAGWQTATGGDANSVSVAPTFVAPTDLHLVAASNPQLLGAGQLVAGFDMDFDNDLRDSSPDIGADEIVSGRTGTIPAGTYRDVNLGTGSISGDVRVTGTLNLSGLVNTGLSTVQLDCGTTVNGAGPVSYVIGNVEKSFCAASSFEFPVGTTPDNAAVGTPPEFTPLTANVTAGTFPSSLIVSVTDGVLPGSNFQSSASRYWNITENGGITADLTFTYLPQDVAGDESTYRVLRQAATTTIYPGGSVNAALNQGFAPGVSEFSSWGAGNIIPTSANGTISGRVVTADGAGIRNAVVTISGGQLSAPITVKTGSFGYYQVENLPVGETYVVSVMTNRFRFSAPSRVINLTDNVLDADFFAEGQ